MLTAWLKGPTEINLWHGVADRAQEQQVNLICFSGGIPNWHQQYESQKNILFNIAGKQNVNGLLIWANILSHTLDPNSLEAFCMRYAPLPMISMGMVLRSIPSIRIDMREGMHKLLSHLIEEHGRRRIAFIRGLEVSQDAEERYQAYRETLVQFGIPLDPNLIVLGDFRRSSGQSAVQMLVDTRQTSFDALVSANDNMAIGAMQALQAHGMHIPEDVIVAGFDDIEETRAVVPSLTTVRAPWYMLGSKSVDLMLSKLAGDPLPEKVILQTEIVFRQSCGCQTISADRQPANLLGSPKGINRSNLLPSPEARRETPAGIDDVIFAMSSIHGLDPIWLKKFIDGLLRDVRSTESIPSLFIQTLVETLSKIPSGTEIIEWKEVLDSIRSNIRLLFQSEDEVIKAHELLEEGYAAIGDIAHRQQLRQRLETEDNTDRLNRMVQTMSTAYDIETLMKLLAFELPGLGIQSCFLSLYDEKGDPPAWARLILAITGTERIPLDHGGIRFPTNLLAPVGIFPKNRRFTFDVEALYFQEEQIGFVLFEIGPRDGEVYATLRGHLSSALKSAELVQVALEAEAKAIKADQLKTHLLANVSHELRTPINIIMGLCQIALSSPSPYGVELPPRLTKDLEYVYDSGEHLVRLINDLLDMSRAEIGELDLCFEPVSPRNLLKEVYETFKETSINKRKDVGLYLEVPEHLPILHADPVRLRQILLNLLSNAIKFTTKGEIILGAEVQLPHIHIWVNDTGSGIQPELQERIFEPFVSAKPAGHPKGGIGLGLSITRRLVALHGGSISLDSQPGQGSTFHVYLPLPGLNYGTAREVNPEGTKAILLWLSRNEVPASTILNLSQKNAFEPCWLESIDSVDAVLQKGRPVALVWDLDNARPADWSIVQKIRSYAQYCQLPLLIFQDTVAGGTPSSGGRVTNVLLKPAGKQTLQHVLDLLPQTKPGGEIWIIDDDPQVLRYYHELIREALPDLVVRSIKGGGEAIRLLSENTPDLVLLDLMMPELDGFQVLEHIRSNTKTASIPVIILTGKLLSYEDVKRLDAPKVFLQTKGILSDMESVAEVRRIQAAADILPQPTSLIVKQALAYIHQNYTRSFSFLELSETIGVSRSYLSRIFKAEIGITSRDYLNRFRIQKAKELLLLSDKSITEIASDVGYEDGGYFSRVFREVSGCSPRAYRQRALTSSSL